METIDRVPCGKYFGKKKRLDFQRWPFSYFAYSYFSFSWKKVFEDGVYAANLVENHLFYYGSRDGKTFQLDLQYEDEADDSEDSKDDEDSEKIVPARNGLKYTYNVTLQN